MSQTDALHDVKIIRGLKYLHFDKSWECNELQYDGTSLNPIDGFR